MRSSALIRATGRAAEFEVAVAEAVELLRAGGVVGLPTETVYGLAANALDASAVEKIFSIKGRPSANPIIVHVSGVGMARRCAAAWPKAAERLAAAFWPGPLTLVLFKAAEIPAIVTAGGTTVGIRWPNHPVIQAVIERCGFPLAAPSANRSGEISPTTAQHVARSLGNLVPLIVDGGRAEIGIESTVLDLTVSPARILRPGMIHEESLQAVVGALSTGPEAAGEVLRSPGLLVKHYSPKARVLTWDGSAAALEALKTPATRVHLLVRTPPKDGARFGQVTVMPREPEAFARALYAEWHRSDEAGAELIVMEAVPAGKEWRAIADRLRRAAA
jgi:L-threonylcarbamoyladenylate synthase